MNTSEKVTLVERIENSMLTCDHSVCLLEDTIEYIKELKHTLTDTDKRELLICDIHHNCKDVMNMFKVKSE